MCAGSRTARSMSPPIASTGIWPGAATRPRSSGKATIPRNRRHITYRQLHEEVCRFANVLKARGVKKGDRVTIYLPMIPEAAYAMLACARIGAVHSVVFGGFSPDSLAGRIADCDSHVVITADEGLRAGKPVPLKANTDEALKKAPSVTDVIVVAPHRRHSGDDRRARPLVSRGSGQGERRLPGRERWARKIRCSFFTPQARPESPRACCIPPAAICSMPPSTHHYVFDYHDGDIYWCTADVGWVTGHSYIVYGPLANGATTLMFEGVPNYPTASRFWEVIDKHKVNIFYTAPTAIRALMREGDEPVKKTSRASLAPSGQRGRADQSRSLALVSPRGGRWPLPDRRHLVADRDRRDSDLAAARRHRPQARLRHQAAVRHRARNRGCRWQGAGRRGQRQSVPGAELARPDAHRLWRSSALHRHLFQNLSRENISPAMAAAAMRMAITGSPAGWTT